MEDFLGTELNVDDHVIVSTGNVIDVYQISQIKGFTPKMVKVATNFRSATKVRYYYSRNLIYVAPEQYTFYCLRKESVTE